MHTNLSRKATLKTEWRAISELRPHSGNARKHPQGQIRKIAQSLHKFGWTNPLPVDGDNMMLCGHKRLEAAQLIGETHAPVIALEHLSEAGRRAYILADNRLAEEAQWSKKVLQTELIGLAELGSVDVFLVGGGFEAQRRGHRGLALLGKYHAALAGGRDLPNAGEDLDRAVGRAPEGVRRGWRG